MDRTPYLKETPYLDFSHPAVRELADEVAAGPGGAKERAVRLFVKVRDGVLYDPYSVSLEPGCFSASHTLLKRRGFCVTKAILYAAGLRALNIPSRLGFVDVINHLATEQLLQAMRTDIFAFHGYVEAWLGGKWVKATPAFNASLCARFRTPPLEFDGEHDAVLQPMNARGDRFMEYVRERGTFEDMPMEAMLQAWHQHYPHFFTGEAPVRRGDFEAEAEAHASKR